MFWYLAPIAELYVSGIMMFVLFLCLVSFLIFWEWCVTVESIQKSFLLMLNSSFYSILYQFPIESILVFLLWKTKLQQIFLCNFFFNYWSTSKDKLNTESKSKIRFHWGLSYLFHLFFFFFLTNSFYFIGYLQFVEHFFPVLFSGFTCVCVSFLAYL